LRINLKLSLFEATCGMRSCPNSAHLLIIILSLFHASSRPHSINRSTLFLLNIDLNSSLFHLSNKVHPFDKKNDLKIGIKDLGCPTSNFFSLNTCNCKFKFGLEILVVYGRAEKSPETRFRTLSSLKLKC